MRTLGSVLTFFLLVLTMHLTILAMNPGIADVRTAPAHASGKSLTAESR